MDSVEFSWESNYFQTISKADLRRAIKVSFVLLVISSISFFLFLKNRNSFSEIYIFLVTISLFLAATFAIDALRNYLRNKGIKVYKVGALGIEIKSGNSNFFYPWSAIAKFTRVKNLYDAKFYEFSNSKDYIQNHPFLKNLLSLIYGRCAETLGEPIEAFAHTFSLVNRKNEHGLYVLCLKGMSTKYVTIDISLEQSQQLEAVLNNKIAT